MSRDQTKHAAFGAYARAAQLAESPARIVFLVHDKLVGELNSAIFAHQQNALDRMCLHLAKTARILSALLIRLDFAAAGSAGRDLWRVYVEALRSVSGTLNDSIVAERLQKTRDTLQTLRDGRQTEKNAEAQQRS